MKDYNEKVSKFNERFELDFANMLIKIKGLQDTGKIVGIIYARVSSEEQAKQGFGIESQIRACQTYADNGNIEIVKIFTDEGISGSKMNRIGLLEAINFCKKHNINLLLTTEASRISRSDNMLDVMEVVDKIKKTGTEIKYVTSNIDTKTAEGKFMENFHYIMSSYEAEKIRVRSLNGVKSKILQGYRTWSDIPLGYDAKYNKQGNKTQRVFRQNKDAKYLKNALEMFASGVFDYNKDIIDYLNKKGVKNPNGKKISYKQIERFFNPKKIMFYAGFIIYPEGGIDQMVPGEHIGIIDQITAQQVLERADKRKRRKHQNKTLFKIIENDFVFKGFLHCPFCGETMTASETTNRKGKTYGYYYCYNKDCANYKKSINKNKLEECFLKFLEKIAFPQQLVDVIEMILKDLWKNKENLEKLELKQKKQEIENIDIQQTKITKSIINLENKTLIDTLEQEWAALGEKKQLLKEQISTKSALHNNLNNLLQQVKILFQQPDKLWITDNLMIKKIIIKILGNKIFCLRKCDIKAFLENKDNIDSRLKNELLNKKSSDNSTLTMCQNVIIRTSPNTGFKPLFDTVNNINNDNSVKVRSISELLTTKTACEFIRFLNLFSRDFSKILQELDESWF